MPILPLTLFSTTRLPPNRISFRKKNRGNTTAIQTKNSTANSTKNTTIAVANNTARANVSKNATANIAVAQNQKYKNIGSTHGEIELNQKKTEEDLNEEIDNEVYAGDKTKVVADMEKMRK